ncbi:hypothetical protein MJO28_010506, partial [Puccinia striiformis f. sp. tritici]
IPLLEVESKQISQTDLKPSATPSIYPPLYIQFHAKTVSPNNVTPAQLNQPSQTLVTMPPKEPTKNASDKRTSKCLPLPFLTSYTLFLKFEIKVDKKTWTYGDVARVVKKYLAADKIGDMKTSNIFFASCKEMTTAVASDSAVNLEDVTIDSIPHKLTSQPQNNSVEGDADLDDNALPRHDEMGFNPYSNTNIGQLKRPPPLMIFNKTWQNKAILYHAENGLNFIKSSLDCNHWSTIPKQMDTNIQWMNKKLPQFLYDFETQVKRRWFVVLPNAFADDMTVSSGWQCKSLIDISVLHPKISQFWPATQPLDNLVNWNHFNNLHAQGRV